MNILHGTIEIAGQMGILCGELKKRGHRAVGYNRFHSYLGYTDHLINTTAKEIEKNHRHMINFFDLFHFHYASSLQTGYQDLAKIKAKGKKMVMHHWGNDVRFHELAKQHNPFAYTGDSPSNEVMDERLTAISEYITDAIVQDYEVYEHVAPYYKNVHVVPIAIDLTSFPIQERTERKRPLLVHAPTNPDFKGTKEIEAAISHLKTTHNFEYKRIERMNHEQAVRLYRDADFIVDQILCGSYGLLSVEAMALGKPVIAYVRDDLADHFPPGLPIVSANPDTVEARIRMLLEYPELRRELGRKGRQFVEKVHAKEKVVDQLEQIYAGL